MANTKISELPALTGANLQDVDLLPIVDSDSNNDGAATDKQTKSITISELKGAIFANTTFTGTPQSSSAPTQDAHLANKKYVDDEIGTVSGAAVTQSALDLKAPLANPNFTGDIEVSGTGTVASFIGDSQLDIIATSGYPTIKNLASADVLQLDSLGSTDIVINSNGNTTEGFRIARGGRDGGGNTLFKLDESGSFEVNQYNGSWTSMDQTTHPILKWSYKTGVGDMMYMASGGNTSIANQMALVISDGQGFKVGKSGYNENSEGRGDVDSTNEFFRITTGGDVGIGNNAPSEKLEVTGNVKVDGDLNITGTPTAPTATSGTNTTQLATTAFVATAVTAATGDTSSPTYTGVVTINNSNGAEGGELRLGLADDHDGTYDFYRIDAHSDTLRIGRQGLTDVILDEAGNAILS